MANESGDMKLLGNFSKLVEFVPINPDYNPANAALKLPRFTPATAYHSIHECGFAAAPCGKAPPFRHRPVSL
jgi:hypothetical protein